MNCCTLETGHVISVLQVLFAHTACEVGEVRPLVGGSSPLEGVLEVCAGEGEFLPVTLSDFSVLAAGVVCRQLGLATGQHLQSSRAKCTIIMGREGGWVVAVFPGSFPFFFEITFTYMCSL